MASLETEGSNAQRFLSPGGSTQDVPVSVDFCSSAESAGAMASRAWDPWGDPSEWVFQTFALGVFPKYPGFQENQLL